ncbi:MAG: hypothetical protein SF187_13200 [Deltaproteobacteria bacterium]|nr:hypothetical protein [Deltaproteobacteria bacterium]
MKIEVAPYKGWSRALHISNGEVELVITLEVGPRILRYAFVGGPNLLKEIPAQMGTSGEPGWAMRGGHRLWASPEDPAYTYFADNHAAVFGTDDGGAWVRSAVDPKSGLSYAMRVSLDASGSGVRIEHTIANAGSHTFKLAPWALTVFTTGGTGIIPLPPYAPHPGDDGRSPADFAPQMSLILWPYFRFNDKRFTFGENTIRIAQDPHAAGPAKIGARLPVTWAAYHLNGTLFCKRFTFDADATYPDGGCNFESYTDAGILELETLSPLQTLAPGQVAQHTETWSLHKDVTLPANDADLVTTLAAIVSATPEP